MASSSNKNEIEVTDVSIPIINQVIQEESNTIIDVNYGGVKLTSLLFFDPFEHAVRHLISWQDRFQLVISVDTFII